MKCNWEILQTDNFSLVSSVWPSGPRAFYLFWSSTWEGDGYQEGILLPPPVWVHFHSPHLLNLLPLCDSKETSDSCQASLRDGRTSFCPSISLSLSQMLISVSTSSLSSTTRADHSSAYTAHRCLLHYQVVLVCLLKRDSAMKIFYIWCFILVSSIR